MKFCTFNPDGSLQCLFECSGIDEIPEGIYQVPEDLAAADCFYFSEGEIHIAPELPVVVTGLVISNVPAGTRVVVGNSVEICNDGVTEIAKPSGVPVMVSLIHPHFKPWGAIL